MRCSGIGVGGERRFDARRIGVVVGRWWHPELLPDAPHTRAVPAYDSLRTLAPVGAGRSRGSLERARSEHRPGEFAFLPPRYAIGECTNGVETVCVERSGPRVGRVGSRRARPDPALSFTEF